jgi:DNA-binding beta-propeller fold protein YncE
MSKTMKLIAHTGMALLLAAGLSFSQKIETKDGVRFVYNEKGGKWGKEPKIALEYVTNIGDLESDDDNVLFYMPSDMATDEEGNMFVLDSGNHRIQKFDSEGNFLASFGRHGQGPGEFQYPQSIDIDDLGNMYVSDSGNQKINILKPDGTFDKDIQMRDEAPGIIRIRGGKLIQAKGASLFSLQMGMMDQDEELPKLIKVLNLEGEVQKEFAEQKDYKDFLVNRMGNRYHVFVDKEGYVYLAFDYQNRIEKYSPAGKLLWRSERELNYDVSAPKTKGSRSGSGGRMIVRMPDMNRVASGISVDDTGRVWVVTNKRQIKEDERVDTNVQVSMMGAQRSTSYSVEGNTDVQETDMYQLEIFDPEGVLLGTIQLDKFVDDIHIVKDKIYILDRMRGMQYYVYKIIE